MTSKFFEIYGINPTSTIENQFISGESYFFHNLIISSFVSSYLYFTSSNSIQMAFDKCSFTNFTCNSTSPLYFVSTNSLLYLNKICVFNCYSISHYNFAYIISNTFNNNSMIDMLSIKHCTQFSLSTTTGLISITSSLSNISRSNFTENNVHSYMITFGSHFNFNLCSFYNCRSNLYFFYSSSSYTINLQSCNIILCHSNDRFYFYGIFKFYFSVFLNNYNLNYYYNTPYYYNCWIKGLISGNIYSCITTNIETNTLQLTHYSTYLCDPNNFITLLNPPTPTECYLGSTSISSTLSIIPIYISLITFLLF